MLYFEILITILLVIFAIYNITKNIKNKTALKCDCASCSCHCEKFKEN